MRWKWSAGATIRITVHRDSFTDAATICEMSIDTDALYNVVYRATIAPTGLYIYNHRPEV